MFFYKQTFSDVNENLFYNLFKKFKGFNIYKPDINYTYNYDVSNHFG